MQAHALRSPLIGLPFPHCLRAMTLLPVSPHLVSCAVLPPLQLNLRSDFSEPSAFQLKEVRISSKSLVEDLGLLWLDLG